MWWTRAAVASVVIFGLADPVAAAVDAALLAAVKAGDHDIVRTLLMRTPDLNAPEADGTTLLHWAVRSDDLDTVEQLLRAGARADAVNRYGMTPLGLAATNGNAAVIERLFGAGASIDTELPAGETVLMTAARTGRPEAIRVLLAHGAMVNATERVLGESALMWAAAENHPEAVQLLIDAGAHLDRRASVEKRRPVPSKVGLNQVLRPGGAWTAIMYAARQGATDAVRVLADAGADLGAADPDGNTALLLAIVNGHYDLAQALIEAGAEVNQADARGMAPLYAAVDRHTPVWVFGRPTRPSPNRLDSLAIVTALLAGGANPNAALTGKVLPRYMRDQDDVLGAGTTPLMRAAKSGDVPVMRLLLAKGADPFRRQANHTTALMLAAGLGFRHTVQEKDALDSGSEADAIAAITLCLELGLDIDAFNDDGKTAVHAAIRRGDRVLEFLAARGARLDTKNREGRTPLDEALRGNAEELRGGVADSTAPLLRALIEKAAGTADSRR
jgi:ankyrin repeat protein